VVGATSREGFLVDSFVNIVYAYASYGIYECRNDLETSLEVIYIGGDGE